MEVQFTDRVLTCSDCRKEFIFTAGEQLFFHEKQFKNDPKRCKPCKGRRSGIPGATSGETPMASALSRTETRTQCSECSVETTVPFKPTQGRPVLCRQCFQNRNRPAAAGVTTPAGAAWPQAPPLEPGMSMPVAAAGTNGDVVQALTAASRNDRGEGLSTEAAVQAVASMEAAGEHSSVASVADLEMISTRERSVQEPTGVPLELIAGGEDPSSKRVAAMMERMEA